MPGSRKSYSDYDVIVTGGGEAALGAAQTDGSIYMQVPRTGDMWWIMFDHFRDDLSSGSLAQAAQAERMSMLAGCGTNPHELAIGFSTFRGDVTLRSILL